MGMNLACVAAFIHSDSLFFIADCIGDIYERRDHESENGAKLLNEIIQQIAHKIRWTDIVNVRNLLAILHMNWF